MGKVYTHFQTKTAQKPTRWGGTYLYGLYKGVPPGVEEIRVIAIAFVYLKHKQNSPTIKSIMQVIPFRQTHTKLYTPV